MCSEGKKVDNFWTLTSVALSGGPRAKSDIHSFILGGYLKITCVCTCVVTFQVHSTMSPKVVQFARRHRKLDEHLRSRVIRLHRKLSVRAIADVVGLQPSSVHALLARDGELQRDMRARLVPTVVHRLATPKAKVRVRGKKKRVTALAVRNCPRPAA